MLRLIPLFPFFIVNLVPAFLGVSLKVFVIATFVGIIPGSFVYATVGAGLGSPDFGRVTSTLDPRVMQLRAKFLF